MTMGAAYPNTAAALRTISQQEGVGALFNGVWLSLAKQVPQCEHRDHCGRPPASPGPRLCGMLLLRCCQIGGRGCAVGPPSLPTSYACLTGVNFGTQMLWAWHHSN